MTAHLEPSSTLAVLAVVSTPLAAVVLTLLALLVF